MLFVNCLEDLSCSPNLGHEARAFSESLVVSGPHLASLRVMNSQ